MLFDELKNKYQNVQLQLYGDCIIIPLNEFQKGWDKTLEAEGHTSRVTDYQFRSVWAVSLKQSVPYKKEPFPEPTKKDELPKPTKSEVLAKNRSQPDWEQTEKDRLMKRWDEVNAVSAMGKARILMKEFPGRSEQALYLMHYTLTGGKATHHRKPRAGATIAKPVDSSELPKEEATAPFNAEAAFNSLSKAYDFLLHRVENIESNHVSNQDKKIDEEFLTGLTHDISHLIAQLIEVRDVLANHKHVLGASGQGEVMVPISMYSWKT